jgi:seryl-tRNA synthetase
MPIDINLIRAEKGGDPAKVIESEKKRGKTGENVRILIEVDKKWREERFKLDKLKERFNKLNEEIKKKKIESKGKEKCEEEVKLRKEVCVEIEEQERVESEKGEEVRKRLRDIGNVLHESVVSSLDEKDNQVMNGH